jgi:hypothetical protein
VLVGYSHAVNELRCADVSARDDSSFIRDRWSDGRVTVVTRQGSDEVNRRSKPRPDINVDLAG